MRAKEQSGECASDRRVVGQVNASLVVGEGLFKRKTKRNALGKK